jgi:AraC-like DNA-binding protein
MDAKIYPTYKIAKILSILQKQGTSAEQLLQGTNLSEDDINSNSTRISHRQVILAYKNATRLSTDPAIGLRTGRLLCVTDYGLYGYALISSATLREALLFSINYHQMATPTVKMSLIIDEENLVASFRMEDLIKISELQKFNLEVQFTLVYSLFKDMVGVDFRFIEIWAQYPKTEYADVYLETLDCPVRFDQEFNELRFHSGWLDSPLQKANSITSQSIKELCDDIILIMSTTGGIAHEVFVVMTQDIHSASNIETLAKHFNMSSRTLRRKLTNQGTSFQNILSDVRKKLSIEYLRGTNLSIDEIADRLGYSDATNFRHAFKKWTGKTVGNYRR